MSQPLAIFVKSALVEDGQTSGGYADALDPSDGEFPMQGLGVFDDPFAVA